MKSAEKLAIRVRRVARGDGEITTNMTVYCDSRGTSLPLGECETCSECEGVMLDPTGRDSFLMCRRPKAAAPAVWSRVVKKMLPAAAAQSTVAEVMTRNVTCVTADVSVEALTALLLERGIGGVPVVDEHGFPIGMVSKTDLLRERHTDGDDEVVIRAGDFEAELGAGFHAERIARATVGEVMTPLAFTLEETAPLSYAAALMSTEGVHRLPIVSGDGRVVGILAALDVLRWLAEETGAH